MWTGSALRQLGSHELRDIPNRQIDKLFFVVEIHVSSFWNDNLSGSLNSLVELLGMPSGSRILPYDKENRLLQENIG
jgi:hypothetical protein